MAGGFPPRASFWVSFLATSRSIAPIEGTHDTIKHVTCPFYHDRRGNEFNRLKGHFRSQPVDVSLWLSTAKVCSGVVLGWVPCRPVAFVSVLSRPVCLGLSGPVARRVLSVCPVLSVLYRLSSLPSRPVRPGLSSVLSRLGRSSFVVLVLTRPVVPCRSSCPAHPCISYCTLDLLLKFSVGISPIFRFVRLSFDYYYP